MAIITQLRGTNQDGDGSDFKRARQNRLGALTPRAPSTGASSTWSTGECLSTPDGEFCNPTRTLPRCPAQITRCPGSDGLGH